MTKPTTKDRVLEYIRQKSLIGLETSQEEIMDAFSMGVYDFYRDLFYMLIDLEADGVIISDDAGKHFYIPEFVDDEE